MTRQGAKPREPIAYAQKLAPPNFLRHVLALPIELQFPDHPPLWVQLHQHNLLPCLMPPSKYGHTLLVALWWRCERRRWGAPAGADLVVSNSNGNHSGSILCHQEDGGVHMF
jgi:hypothetical protein